jgi:hypothetical protein
MVIAMAMAEAGALVPLPTTARRAGGMVVLLVRAAMLLVALPMVRASSLGSGGGLLRGVGGKPDIICILNADNLYGIKYAKLRMG